MREKREYQQKVLNSNSKITICPWARDTGKSTTIFMDIEKDIIEKSEYHHIIVTGMMGATILKAKLLKNYLNNFNNYKIDIESNEGVSWVLINNDEDHTLKESICIISRNDVYDYVNKLSTNAKFKVYFDSYYPLMSGLINILRFPNSRIFIFHNEITDLNIIPSSDSYVVGDDGWYDKEINKLKKEFSDIDGQENNTKRRECILSMINTLSNMKKDNRGDE